MLFFYRCEILLRMHLLWVNGTYREGHYNLFKILKLYQLNIEFQNFSHQREPKGSEYVGKT